MKEIASQTSDDPVVVPRSERRKAVRLHFSWWYALLVLFFALGIGAGYLVWGISPERGNPQAAVEQTTATTDPNSPRAVTRYEVEEDDDPVFGHESAPITIIVFSDYECPYCQRWHNEVWPQLNAAYPDQIRLVYRDFPLYNIHSNAGPAAEAANCAGDQNQYWEFHHLLLSGDNNLGLETYQRYATTLGLDMNLFNDCIESKKYESEVNADYTYAVGLGIQSTPTFFINGIALIGAQPFDAFREVIDLEMAGLLTE